jgi:hypothetical protein
MCDVMRFGVRVGVVKLMRIIYEIFYLLSIYSSLVFSYVGSPTTLDLNCSNCHCKHQPTNGLTIILALLCLRAKSRR